jgi:predicted nucleotidyltransferase
MMSLKFGLSEADIEKIKLVFLKYSDIEKVVIYGSRAKGNYKPSSDIDLTIFTENKEISFLFKIENEIDDLMLPYKVDLSIFALLENESLKDHILRIGQVFYYKTGSFRTHG